MWMKMLALVVIFLALVAILCRWYRKLMDNRLKDINDNDEDYG